MKVLTIDQITPYFHYPIHEASALLGVSIAELKENCRNLGLKRWPFYGKNTKKIAKQESPFGAFYLKKKEIGVLDLPEPSHEIKEIIISFDIFLEKWIKEEENRKKVEFYNSIYSSNLMK